MSHPKEVDEASKIRYETNDGATSWYVVGLFRACD